MQWYHFMISAVSSAVYVVFDVIKQDVNNSQPLFLSCARQFIITLNMAAAEADQAKGS